MKTTAILRTNRLIFLLFLIGCVVLGKHQHSAAAMVANFTVSRLLIRGKTVMNSILQLQKPTEENPSLLQHLEVSTLFHEFGHVMHEVLTTAKLGMFAGLMAF